MAKTKAAPALQGAEKPSKRRQRRQPADYTLNDLLQQKVTVNGHDQLTIADALWKTAAAKAMAGSLAHQKMIHDLYAKLLEYEANTSKDGEEPPHGVLYVPLAPHSMVDWEELAAFEREPSKRARRSRR